MDNFDYTNWESSQYTVNVDLPATLGDTVTDDVVTRERPFILHQIKHTVVDEDGDDPEQYSIDWSIQNEKRYWKGAQAPMARMYGSTHTGVWSPLSSPILMVPKTTLYVTIQNHNSDGEARKIQILFEGMERIS